MLYAIVKTGRRLAWFDIGKVCMDLHTVPHSQCVEHFAAAENYNRHSVAFRPGHRARVVLHNRMKPWWQGQA